MRKITKFLCRLVKKTSHIINNSFQVYEKDDEGDLVTDIDKKVEKFLVDKLNKKFPSYSIVSEEYNADNNMTDNCFIIDPIDGTKNFASGIPLWGIQVAVVEKKEVAGSVLYFPPLNEMFYADAEGAFLNGKKLDLSTIKPVQKNRLIYDIEGGDKFGALETLEKEISRNFRYIACSSLGYSWVAAGRLNGFILRKNQKWDNIPGLYLVKMANGHTIDEEGAHIGATTKEMCDALYEHARLLKPKNKIKSKK